jgi:hypothetical protein
MMISLWQIVLVWTLALAITSPITVLGIVEEHNILSDGQFTSNPIDTKLKLRSLVVYSNCQLSGESTYYVVKL